MAQDGADRHGAGQHVAGQRGAEQAGADEAAGVDALHGLYLPRFVAELTGGWAATEGATFTAPDGTLVAATIDQAEGTARDLAHRHLDVLRSSGSVDAVEVVAEDDRATLVGLPAHEVRLSLRDSATRDGGDGQDGSVAAEGAAGGAADRVGRLLVAVDGDRAITVHALWRAADGAGAAAFEQVVAGLQLTTRMPPGERTAETAVALAAGTAARAAPSERTADPAMWAGLRSAWDAAATRTGATSGATSGTPSGKPSVGTAVGASVEPTPSLTWSVQELATLALLRNIGWFPTLGGDVLDGLGPREREATLTTAIGSLLARGSVELDDGRYVTAPHLDGLFKLTAAPELTVHLERTDRSSTRGHWYGATTESAVRITTATVGLRSTSTFDPRDLVTLLLDDAGLPNGAPQGAPPGAPGSGDGPTVGGTELLSVGDVTGEASDVRTVTQVRTGWWAGKVALGGHVTWLERDDGRLQLAETITDSDDGSVTGWRATDADADVIRAELLAHLPGHPSTPETP